MLHETTQRRICRITFLAGCVLPTLAVFATVAQVWWPSYAQQWEVPLSQMLDCRATIQQVHTPNPGITQFDRVMLADSETGAEWATFEGVTYTVQSRHMRISVNRAEVRATSGLEIGRSIERLLRGNESRDFEVAIESLNYVTNGSSLSVPHVHLKLTAIDTGSRMHLWSTDSAAAPRMLVERNRQLDPPATRVSFDTGTKPIPCRLLAAWDRFEQLGEQAQFLGRIETTASYDSVRGRLSGRLFNLHPTPTLGAAGMPTQIVVEEIGWSTGTPDSLGAQPAGPVAAILAQFSSNEPSPAEQPLGDVTWELAPWVKRSNVEVHAERDETIGRSVWR